MLCEGQAAEFARQHLFYALSFKTLPQSVRMLWGLGPLLFALCGASRFLLDMS